MNYRTYGLSTCCSRFSKKFPVISQKVAQMLLKKQSEVAFYNESCSKVARKDKNFFWSDAKICKLYNKSKISKHFCAILRRNQRCYITLLSFKTKKCNEPIKLLNNPASSPETLKSVECESSSTITSTILNFQSLKTSDLGARLLLSCALICPTGVGGVFGSFSYRKFIDCLLKHVTDTEERPI